MQFWASFGTSFLYYSIRTFSIRESGGLSPIPKSGGTIPRPPLLRRLLAFLRNHGPILYRFQDIARYWRKMRFFSSNPRWFDITAEGAGSPWNRVTLDGLKKLEWWGYQLEKSLMISFSHLDITIQECDRQTDGRTDIGLWHRAPNFSACKGAR